MTLIDRGTQADLVRRGLGEVCEVELSGALSPETPSVVCQSSLDVTVSSSAEVSVTSCVVNELCYVSSCYM